MTTLNRETFTIDRTLEFFSEKELQMQIGHSANRAIRKASEIYDETILAPEDLIGRENI